jgi:hypothetical protein
MYLHDHETTMSQGPGPDSALGGPPMHPRCKSLSLTLPGTHKEVEEAVKRWIATCVQSRTKVDGVAVHRERALVEANASLLDIWNRILRHHVGEKVLITAEYIWGPNRVESIKFSTTAAPPPPPAPTPRQPLRRLPSTRALAERSATKTRPVVEIEAACPSSARAGGRHAARTAIAAASGTFLTPIAAGRLRPPFSANPAARRVDQSFASTARRDVPRRRPMPAAG